MASHGNGDNGGRGGPGGEHLAEVMTPVIPGDHEAELVSRLPRFLSSFVGRDREVDELAGVLGSARLVTLTGPGGIGKTRLAVAVAEHAGPGRAYFVDVAPLREAHLVGEAIAAAFGLGELRGRDLAELLAAALSRQTLLVLDNCEHLIDACTALVYRALLACPVLHVLATSQQHLGVSGEVVWEVPPLDVPEAGREVEPEEALGSGAVRLFCDRAAVARRGFVPAPEHLGAIVEICRRLDANPLAIELAAAQVRALPPSAIAARLQRRFELLRARPGLTEGRHHTLAAALEWSHDLLPEGERVLLRRLAVFAGGFSLEAVEAVGSGGGLSHDDVLPLLDGLVSRSLVMADTGAMSARYRLLETVRHYAARALAAAGEEAEWGHRHAAWYTGLAEEVAGAVEEGGAGVAALEPELDNVRAALEWCAAHGHGELGLRLASAHMVAWEAAGRFAEAREWLGRMLAVGEGAPASRRARALYSAGFAALMLGDLEAARRDVRASLALSVEAADPPSVTERTEGLLSVVSTFGDGPQSVEDLEAELDEARVRLDERLGERLVGCAHARLFRGEPVAAQGHFEELVVVARQRGDDGMVATALVGLGAAAIAQGDCARARHHLEEGIALATAVAQVHTHTLGEIWLAELERLTRDPTGAARRLAGCLARARPMGAPYPLALALLGLGRVALDQGDAEAARRHLEEALGVAGGASLRHVEAAVLEGLGEVALAVGDVASAHGLFDQALAVAQKWGEQTAAARATYQLAELVRARGERDRAASLQRDALRQFHATGVRPGLADSLEALACLAVARDNVDVAARLLGAAEALRQAGGFVRPVEGRARYESDLARARAHAGQERFEAAWREGAELSVEDAVAYASKRSGRHVGVSTGHQRLSPTERQVVELVRQGLTNVEVAERLFTSRETVKTHLSRAFAKLGVRTRRELRDVTLPDA